MHRIYEGMSIREISEFLFVEDPPGKADLIFVFGGKRRERAEKAVRLYQDGHSARIWLSGGDKRSTGIPEAEALRTVAVEAGVPAAAIGIETASTTTLENVQFSAPLLDQAYGWGNLRTVILVSAPVHMRRAKRVFARHCPRETQIVCCPDDRPDVRSDNWWTTEAGRRLVLRELETVRHQAQRGEL